MDFTAFDVETAQNSKWSICQIGIVEVIENKIVNEFSSLIKPPNNEYSTWNTRIHGIKAELTENSLTFDLIWNKIKHYFINRLIIGHYVEFDKDALEQTLKYYDIPVPHLECICTYHRTGYKLDEVCQAFDIDPGIHHDALSDARACAEVYLKLLDGKHPDPSKIKVKSNRNNRFEGHEHLSGDVLKPDLENSDQSSPFYGKKVVFTGVLSSISRGEAADIVKKMGADINTSISKKTEYVITGREPGPSKMRKIEKLNSEGASIEIINEDKFLRMIKN